VRGISVAAAYVPAAVLDGRRTAGPDEDGFTLGATAIERLWESGSAPVPAARLALVGDLPPNAEDNFERFLGYPVLTERFREGATGLRAAAQDAADPARGAEPILMVAVDLAADSESAPRAASRPDAAAAVWVQDSGAADLLRALARIPGGEESATAPLFRLARERRSRNPSAWVGDWEPGPGREWPTGTSHPSRPTVPAAGPFSQGAYVPRPRYLENIPSRWWFAAERCPSCATVTFPVRGRCRQCGVREGLETLRLPRDGGEVLAATVIGPGGQPTEFDEQVASGGPYGVVLVELVPGARVTLQVTDARPGELSIGGRVATRLRRLYRIEGEWRYGRKAVPLG
jgi:uncharacterized OB-fold protein